MHPDHITDHSVCCRCYLSTLSICMRDWDSLPLPQPRLSLCPHANSLNIHSSVWIRHSGESARKYPLPSCWELGNNMIYGQCVPWHGDMDYQGNDKLQPFKQLQ